MWLKLLMWALLPLTSPQLPQPCQKAARYLTAEHADRMEKRMLVCLEVVHWAAQEEVDPWLAVSVAYHESRLTRGAVSKVGAQGPMQVLPKYWCQTKQVEGCRLVHAGVKALKRVTTKFGVEKGLAKYAGGNNPGPVARQYAKTVSRWARRRR